MKRHPLYFSACLLTIGYLSFANSHGWSFWHSVSRPFSSSGGGRSSYYGEFNHK